MDLTTIAILVVSAIIVFAIYGTYVSVIQKKNKVLEAFSSIDVQLKKRYNLIPNILKSTFGNNKTFEMYGQDYDTKDGTCVRDYINIEDLAHAHILALEYLNNGGKTNYFNLGTNEGNTVKEVFNTCEKITQQKIPVNMMPRRDGDPAKLVADNTKIKEFLGWESQYTLDESIKTAYEWEKVLQKRGS